MAYLVVPCIVEKSIAHVFLAAFKNHKHGGQLQARSTQSICALPSSRCQQWNHPLHMDVVVANEMVDYLVQAVGIALQPQVATWTTSTSSIATILSIDARCADNLRKIRIRPQSACMLQRAAFGLRSTARARRSRTAARTESVRTTPTSFTAFLGPQFRTREKTILPRIASCDRKRR